MPDFLLDLGQMGALSAVRRRERALETFSEVLPNPATPAQTQHDEICKSDSNCDHQLRIIIFFNCLELGSLRICLKLIKLN